MSRAQDLGGELGRQLFSQPRSLAVAASLLGIMGLIPGMPNLAFLVFAALLGTGAWWQSKRLSAAARAAAAPAPAAVPLSREPQELSWDDVQPADLLGLEVGFRLVRWWTKPTAANC